MNKNLLIVIMMILLGSCGAATEKFNYPVTRRGDIVDTIFGVPVPDPYRWLEDDMSAETAEWVKKQNEVTFGYLEKIPYRGEILKGLTDLCNYEKYGMPFKREITPISRRTTVCRTNMSIIAKKMRGESGAVSRSEYLFRGWNHLLGEMGFSKDGTMFAYSISEGGSDWRK